MPPLPADLRQRAHLDRQRAHLVAKAEVLSKRTLQFRYELQIARDAGEGTDRITALLRKAERFGSRIGRALLAINDELDEGKDG